MRKIEMNSLKQYPDGSFGLFGWIIWINHLDEDERCTNEQASAKYYWSSNLFFFGVKLEFKTNIKKFP